MASHHLPYCLSLSLESKSKSRSSLIMRNFNTKLLKLLCISAVLFITGVTSISGGDELNELDSSFDDSIEQQQTANHDNSDQVFQIPDQQAFLGKLFYYRITRLAHIHNLTLTQAGHHLNPSSPPLPEWLHFNPDSGELFGAPLEKKIYFIQVAAILTEPHHNHHHSPSSKTYEDIFVIEVVDLPAYLQAGNRIANKFAHQESGSRDVALYQCRIELKNVVQQIDILYRTVVSLHGDGLTALFTSSPQPYQHNNHNVDKLKEWLNHFTVTFGGGSQFDSWKVSYEVERCGSNALSTKQQDHIYLDQDSEKLLARLSELRIESELVKISSNTSPDLADQSHPKPSQLPEVNVHHHKRNLHRRRNAYVDDPDIYSTPTLQNEIHTLTTSVIDVNQDFILSRTLIPSMISPTYNGPNPAIQATPTFGGSLSNNNNHARGNFHQPAYPHLYSTPVLMPDMSSLIIKSVDQIDQMLATPVLPVMEATTSSAFPDFVTSSKEVPTPAVTDKQGLDKEVRVGDESNTTTAPSTTSSTTTEGTPAPTIRPNHRPFVNRRIAKLSITAGKYWQYTIPEDTFLDKEDGNTKNLRLAFFKDSELPPIDYWIQFDHENQYLYALPTEENIGKYRFNLVAIDSNGAEVSEVLEIYVRQPRESLTYTHRFILANITWDSNLFVERIQAVSTLLQRMATQVFEEVSSNDPSEAVQRQTLLHSISVLNVMQNVDGNWSITWSNDTLRRHPCPKEEIERLYSKLRDITHPLDHEGYSFPSPDLRNALSPEFKLFKIKLEFIGRSACGTYATSITNDTTTQTRHKEKVIEFRNKLSRLGPYKLGEPFKFQIPRDTVYSKHRQVDTRDLVLTIFPVEPEIDLPDFIYFDDHEQTIYGLPYKPEHIHTHELQLIAEDPINGEREKDIFAIDVVHDGNTREDYLFEVTMSFLIKNVEKLKEKELRLTPKDFYQVAHLIATRLMANSNLDAFRMLEINRHRFTKISDELQELLNGPDMYTPKTHLKRNVAHHHTAKRRRSYHHLRFKRGVLDQRPNQKDYYYEFVWTNRSLVTSYLHSANAFGGGTVFETETCPKDSIHRDIYGRLFPSSAKEFLTSIQLAKNVSHLDVMEIYLRLFESIEANIEFLSVEWTPKSVCSINSGLEHRVLGAQPIRDYGPETDESDQNASAQPTQSATSTPGEGGVPGAVPPGEEDIDPLSPTQTYLGDKLLTLIIPPIAIMAALLFALTIACCFHRANMRRKAMGNMQEITEENPNLYRQRIPIQFEFERGGGPGMRSTEQESILDSGRRHPIQIMPMKRGGGPPLPSHHGGRQPKVAGPGGQHMPYQMLPQQ